MAVAPGEFFSILGPSGSGKTTTMMMVAGFIAPTSGKILVDGRDVSTLPPQHRGLGVVFQNYALFTHLTVAENIAFPLKVRRNQRKDIALRVDDMLRLVDLKGYEGRKPSQLSGGQQQRVALARALAFNPGVLLMDEPLGALDKRLRDHMRSEIGRIHRTSGVSVIYVTHDQDEALTMSDRVAIMNDGRIEQIDTPRGLYDAPRTKFVGGFLGQMNFISGTVLESKGPKVVCETPIGRIVGIARGKISERGPVSVAFRPERVHVTTKLQPGANSFTGTLTHMSYAGDAMIYTIEKESQKVQCKISTGMQLPTPDQSSQLTVTWREEDTQVFFEHHGDA